MTASGNEAPSPRPSRELYALRRYLFAAVCGGAFVCLGAAYFAGVVPRAPVAVAGVVLVLALVGSVLGSVAAAARRALWRIRRKLIVSYLLIAFGPLFVVTVLLAFGGYAATGQFLAFLSWRHLSEISREVDDAVLAIAERLGELARRSSSPYGLRKALDEDADLVASVRSLRDRYPSLVASALVRARDGTAYVPAGLDWPGSVRAGRPRWFGRGRFGASFIVGAGGAVEVCGALSREEGTHEVYVEVRLALDGATLDVVKRYMGVDLRVVERTGRGAPLRTVASSFRDEPAPRSGLASLPVVGVFFISPVRWDTGQTMSEGRLVVTERSLDGLVRDLYGFRAENRALLASAISLVLVVLALIEGACLAIGISLARSITGAIHEISEGTERIERGELSYRIPVQSDDQLGALSQSFNRMAEGIERLVTEAGGRERLEEELRIGRRIQQSLLPGSGFRNDQLEIAAVSFPAREVGGDYYDYFDLGGGRLGLLIADVSGKGTEAAFYMAEVKGIMLALVRIHDRPADVLERANDLLAQSLDRRTFVTMTYGVVSFATGEIAIARAGHCPMLFLPKGGEEVVCLRPAGLALGIDRKGGFRRILEERTIRYRPGDLALFYTDGVTDTMSATGEFYGEERLALALLAARDKDAAAIRDSLIAELRRFAAEGPPDDDLTVIVCRAL